MGSPLLALWKGLGRSFFHFSPPPFLFFQDLNFLTRTRPSPTFFFTHLCWPPSVTISLSWTQLLVSIFSECLFFGRSRYTCFVLLNVGFACSVWAFFSSFCSIFLGGCLRSPILVFPSSQSDSSALLLTRCPPLGGLSQDNCWLLF